MEAKNQQTSQKRNVAFKVCISDIIEGEYIKKEGWEPNILKTKRGEVSRVNIIGVAISIDETITYSGFAIDDSTGTVSVRIFDEDIKIKMPKTGQIILLIGRVRKYGEEIYILPEIIKPITDLKWVIIRKKELGIDSKKIIYKKPSIEKIEKNIIKKTEEKKDENLINKDLNPYEKVLEFIKNMDQGFGVSYEEIILKSHITDCEKIIQNLIEEGEVFEARPGILKVI